MPAVTLLGPQRFTPTLGELVAQLGITGRLASVTAGWQEREDEDVELHEHLGERTVNLMLYARGEDVFERDPELGAAHRERQDRLRCLQEHYRIRLGRAQEALRELEARAASDPADLLEPAKEDTLEGIRALDRNHLGRIRVVHEQFERALRPAERPAVTRHMQAIERLLDGTQALLIAGGHVAVLLNRLRLFGFQRLAAARDVFAWSAGAMAVAEQVVLFHHAPPQGFGNSEVLEHGLGLVRGVVAFPHARRRLRLDEQRRVRVLAGRFAPAECLALDDGAWMVDRAGARQYGPGVARFELDGTVAPAAVA